MAIPIPLKEKYKTVKSGGGTRSSGSRTGNKKIKKTQGTGPRRKAYGPF